MITEDLPKWILKLVPMPGTLVGSLSILDPRDYLDRTLLQYLLQVFLFYILQINVYVSNIQTPCMVGASLNMYSLVYVYSIRSLALYTDHMVRCLFNSFKIVDIQLYTWQYVKLLYQRRYDNCYHDNGCIGHHSCSAGTRFAELCEELQHDRNRVTRARADVSNPSHVLVRHGLCQTKKRTMI